eukprot:3929197-Amphidinium_carterae.1
MARERPNIELPEPKAAKIDVADEEETRTVLDLTQMDLENDDGTADRQLLEHERATEMWPARTSGAQVAMPPGLA